jgi:integrase
VASVTITTRQTVGGTRYVVRYRLGGRAYPITHGGSFRTLREAKTRRDLIGGELAAGRNPADLLQQVFVERRPVLTLSSWTEKFLASRLDVDESTRKTYASALKKACHRFGSRDPASLRADDVAEWVAELARSLKPGTVRLYLLALRLLFDYVGVDPNPARDKRVRWPKQERVEPKPPSAEHFAAIVAAASPKYRLLLVTIEQGALRLSEAVSLTWGDVDRAGLRLRLPRSATKRDSARWVYLPEWLMDAIEDTCPLEDRTPERRVFQCITDDGCYQAMLRACQTAGVPSFHPHDLRHRRISVWHQSGVPARELAERAGHARASMSLDVYSHVMPTDEVSEEQFRAVLGS